MQIHHLAFENVRKLRDIAPLTSKSKTGFFVHVFALILTVMFFVFGLVLFLI